MNVYRNSMCTALYTSKYLKTLQQYASCLDFKEIEVACDGHHVANSTGNGIHIQYLHDIVNVNSSQNLQHKSTNTIDVSKTIIPLDLIICPCYFQGFIIWRLTD